MNSPEHVAHLQTKYGLSYHVPYAFQAERLIGLRGKRVLEVGGSLEKGFVLEELGVRQWLAIDEPDYWHEIDTGKVEIHGTPPPTTGILELAVSEYGPQIDYQVYGGSILNLPDSFHDQFDMVFSIAAFEHITNLPIALDCMHAALAPGGKLFSMFSPVWSAHDGHHLPRIRDRSGQIFEFHSSPIPPWAHLLMRPPELFEHLTQHTDREAAGDIVHYVYHSSHINRLFTEDYIHYFQHSRFRIDTLQATFPVTPSDPAVLQQLTLLYPGREHFTNNGVLVVLEKQSV